MRRMRKGSEDLDSTVNPYILRKIKFKQFMRKNAKNLENSANNEKNKKMIWIIPLFGYLMLWISRVYINNIHGN